MRPSEKSLAIVAILLGADARGATETDYESALQAVREILDPPPEIFGLWDTNLGRWYTMPSPIVEEDALVALVSGPKHVMEAMLCQTRNENLVVAGFGEDGEPILEPEDFCADCGSPIEGYHHCEFVVEEDDPKESKT